MKLTKDQRRAARIIDGVHALLNAETMDCGTIVYDHLYSEYTRTNNGDPDGGSAANLLYALLRYAAMLSGKPEPPLPKVGWL